MGLTGGLLRVGGLRNLSTSIPASAIAQYDFRNEDGTLPVSDQTKNGNDLSTGQYTSVNSTINGYQAGEFDGTDDVAKDPFSSVSSISARYVVFIVCKVNNTNDFGVLGDAGNTDDNPQILQFSGERRFRGGDNTVGGPSVNTDTALLLTLVIDSTQKLRRNGTEIISSTNAGTSDLGGIMLGEAPTYGHWDGAVGFCEVHDGSVSRGLETREKEIADQWGITI